MLRGAALVFLSRNLQKVLALAIYAVIGWKLGERGVGVYGLLVWVPVFVTNIAALGIGPSHVYFRGQGRIELREVLGNSVAGAAILGGLAILAFSLLRPVLRMDLDELNPWLLTIATISFPFVIIQSYADYLWIGENRMGVYSALYIARFLTLPVLLLAGLSAPDPYIGLAVAVLANVVLSAAVNLFTARRLYRLRARFDRAKFASVMRYGLRIQPGTVAQAIGYRFDYLLINIMIDTRATGLYIAATNLAEALWIVPATISTVLLPRVATKEVGTARALTARTCRVVFATSLVGGLAIFVAAEFLPQAVYGRSSFEQAIAPLRILLIGTVVFSLQKVLANYFIGQGKASWFLRATLVSMAINLGLNFWLIPKPEWGIQGAALASAVSYSVSTIVLAILFLRETGMHPLQLLVPNRTDLAEAAGQLGKLRARARAVTTRGAIP